MTFIITTMRSIAAASLLALGSASASIPAEINNEFSVKGKALENLLASATPASEKDARKLEEGYYADYHISQYSIQFQGCHHIQQWNENAYYDEVRVETKRLVRFRLVPYESCDVVPAWATYLQEARGLINQFDDYGEYIVDMNTFVYNYLIAASEMGSSDCNDYVEKCQETCDKGDDDNVDDGYNDCMDECYGFYGCSFNDDAAAADDAANADDGAVQQLDALDYAYCAAVDFNGDDDAGMQHYVGPYCANHGAEIKFSLFSDDTCTNMAKCNGGTNRGNSCYEASTGVALPYSQANLVQDPCVPCSENFLSMSDVDDEFDYGYPRELCSNLYAVAGKCETHMSKGNKIEAACSYIQGVRVGISDSGVVMGVQRSREADLALGGLGIAVVLLGGYIYHLYSLF